MIVAENARPIWTCMYICRKFAQGKIEHVARFITYRSSACICVRMCVYVDVDVDVCVCVQSWPLYTHGKIDHHPTPSASQVVISDKASVLPLIQRNVEKNNLSRCACCTKKRKRITMQAARECNTGSERHPHVNQGNAPAIITKEKSLCCYHPLQGISLFGCCGSKAL